MDKKSKKLNLIKLSEYRFWNNLPETGGVYYILSCKGKKRNKINRVLGVDNEGILYIGKSDYLKERLRMLWRVLNPKLKATAHTFGQKYNESKKLKKLFPMDSLFIDFKTSKKPKYLESKLLKRYFDKFGEVPPFNSSK